VRARDAAREWVAVLPPKKARCALGFAHLGRTQWHVHLLGRCVGTYYTEGRAKTQATGWANRIAAAIRQLTEEEV